ncbi:MAG: methyltransferase domain-containing protein [Anaerolineales bacterium]|nr:methyltransferase domain-containing protein [Anaerolineales bacterium]
MRPEALSHLRCPQSHEVLDLHPFATDGPHIMSGVLVSSAAWYPIIDGIPRLLPHQPWPTFAADHAEALNQLGFSTATPSPPPNKLQHQTSTLFGYEWQLFRRFGWDDPVYNLAWSRNRFAEMTLIQPDEWADKLVLDAGCGNGRYSYCAAEQGATVYAVDLGAGVEAAFANTRDLSTVHVIQGDIFQLPFAPATFDTVFSVGVLMHTGDAQRAAHALCELTKTTLAVTVYGRGNIFYEAIDGGLRAITTRLSIANLHRFVEVVLAIRCILDRLYLTRWVQHRLGEWDEHPHCVFDWYGAPIATHHNLEEVALWMLERGLAIEQASPMKSANRWWELLGATAAPITVRAARR